MSGNKEIIKVNNLYKSFRIPHEKTNSLKGAALSLFKKKPYTVYEAANDISFEVKQGEFLGIIGRNGCGKSTMLKMLAGIYLPDKGGIRIGGSLSPFLELGVGFNPDLTARENIYLNGTILGMSRKEIDEIFDEVLEFSELQEFVDMKLKNFSSGMQVRLAFAVAIHAHADILLIDEVLAVGDINFQKKCFDVFRDFKEKGKTIVFVTHDMGSVRSFCDRVVVFDKGKKLFDGNVEGAIDLYTKLNFGAGKMEEPTESEYGETLGNHDAVITKYSIANSKNKETSVLNTGEKFIVKAEIEVKRDISLASFGLMLRSEVSQDLFGSHSRYREKPMQIKDLKKGELIEVVFSGTMILETGSYYLTLKASEEYASGDHQILNMLNNFVLIEVTDKKSYWGMIKNDIEIVIKRSNG